MRTGSVKALIVSVLVVGAAWVMPLSSASALSATVVSADARDRAILKTTLQRSWVKTDSQTRQKTCWMWWNRRDLVQESLAANFAQYGFEMSDVYAVARSHFNRVC